MSIAVERLARLAGAGKPITGEGHSTAPTDPMLIAASLPSGDAIAEELVRFNYMGDPHAEIKLLRLLTVLNAKRHCLEIEIAYGLSRAAIKSLGGGSRCKGCKGTGVMPDQATCKPCDGSGLRVMSDNARAKIAGIPRETFRRNYAEIADLIESDLHRIDAVAQDEIKKKQCA